MATSRGKVVMLGIHGAAHYEIQKYSLSTSKVRAKVLQDLTVQRGQHILALLNLAGL